MKFLLLPIWFVNLVRLVRIRELSRSARVKRLGLVFLGFLFLIYSPLVIGALLQVKMPVWWIGPVPIPLTNTWSINTVLVLYFNFVLNVLSRWALSYLSISKRLEVAFVQCGLKVPGLEDEPAGYPDIVYADPQRVVIAGKGFTPAYFESNKAELSSAAGVFLWSARAARNGSGEALPGLVELFYTEKDLPALVTLDRMLAAEWEYLTLGLSVSGWEYMNLEKDIHLGVAGLPGSGKSVFLRSLIVQVMLKYPLATVIGLDFKSGAEFSAFQGLGNFVLCDDFQAAAKALEEVYQEYLRRAALVRRLNVETVYQVRGSQGERINPVFVVLDEAAELFYPLSKSAPVWLKDGQNIAVEYLGKLARLARFAGIHLAVATQRPDVKAVPAEVRSMLKTRVAFQLQQKEDSILWLNRAAALDLPDIPGRFLLASDTGLFRECQALYINKNQVKERLADLPAGVSQLHQKITKRINQIEREKAEPERRRGAPRRSVA